LIRYRNAILSFCNHLIHGAIYFEEKTKLSLTEKILSEETAKYDDTNELKEEQRNDKLYLIEISVIALSRTIF
jgi:hypothetical protein